jgi:lysophospholipase L1-like esterase
VINDGLTAQSQYGGIGGKNWTSRLHRAIGQSGLDVYVRKEDRVVGYSAYGPPGPTFQSVVARMVNADTDLVVLFGGSNDTRSMPALADGVTRAISGVRMVAPGAKIILVGPTWFRPEPPAEQIRAVDDTIGAVAAENDVEFISPIREDWFAGDPALVAPDGMHPSNAGHEVISKRLADRVIGALRSVNGPSAGHP